MLHGGAVVPTCGEQYNYQQAQKNYHIQKCKAMGLTWELIVYFAKYIKTKKNERKATIYYHFQNKDTHTFKD